MVSVSLMIKCLVTGAAGFLGFYVAKYLVQQGYHVYVIDNFIRGDNDQAYQEFATHPNVTRYDLDLCDDAAVKQLPQDIDYIFHLAALNGTQNFYERPLAVLRCCTLPTFYLLEHYRGNNQLKRFIYAGTSEAYASTVTHFKWPVPTQENVPLSIDDPTNPRWSYGAAKIHGEVLTIQACRELGLDYSIIRYHNAYGPRMGDKHVIPDFLTRIKQQGQCELFGFADTRSFIYAEDAAIATVKIALAKNCANEIINVGGEQEIKILDLAERILELAGIEQEIICHPSPKGSVARRAPDISKLLNLTDYQPKWDLNAGLRETIKYYLLDENI